MYLKLLTQTNSTHRYCPLVRWILQWRNSKRSFRCAKWNWSCIYQELTFAKEKCSIFLDTTNVILHIDKSVQKRCVYFVCLPNKRIIIRWLFSIEFSLFSKCKDSLEREYHLSPNWQKFDYFSLSDVRKFLSN